MGDLTANFSLIEFTHSNTAKRRGIDNTPPPAVLVRLRHTAKMMEVVRSILGAPVMVSSGYRSPDLNVAVGGSRTSDHVTGNAVDFVCPRFGSPFEVCQELARHKQALGYDHAYQLDSSCRGMKAVAASVVSGDGKLAMDLLTTKPALQFYSGNHLAGISARDGATYLPHQGLALETEFLPDCPNHPEWPESDAWLEPGQTYRQSTALVFRPL